VRDTGFEVVHEAGDRVVVQAAIVGDHTGGELARDRPARRLIGRLNANLELWPDVLRHLERFAPNPASVPAIEVKFVALSTYDELAAVCADNQTSKLEVVA
jgi:hypothetical protein